MQNDFYFSQIERNTSNEFILDIVSSYSETNKKQMFLIKSPLGEKKQSYDEFENVLTLLMPGHKIVFVNYGTDKSNFEDYIEDYIADLGSISYKYDYLKIIGRPRVWREFVVYHYTCNGSILELEQIINESKISNPKEKRDCELLISLLIGSINNINRFKVDVPTNLLEKVKQNIILFDGKQTSFIHKKNSKSKVVIQGLSGTGKTELLLHKLKDLYVNHPESRIGFTCYSKVLANTLLKRIPEFFNFMRVDEQIKWDRLKCVGSWGSFKDKDSGIYRYICYFYELDFLSLRDGDLEKVSRIAFDQITEKMIEEKGYAFDYILIDESQDFPESFFNLCEKITKEEIYIAGDIFQSIFDKNVKTDIETDYLLSKCYRTDPKTLMFAHGLGMALFEKPKLRWLTDEDWDACGYLIDKSVPTKYIVTREPLKRFEDLTADEEIDSVELIEIDNNVQALVNNVINIIKSLKSDYPTLLPNDFAIMFPNEKNNRLYEMVDVLANKIQNNFGWNINKSYETKQVIDGEVLVSNKNNVKGLEFSFVICVTSNIVDSFSYRNALYMMLTRSFLKTFFIIVKNESSDKILNIKTSLQEILDTGKMTLKIPSIEEKLEIEQRLIKFDENSLTQADIVYKLFNQLDIPEKYRDKVYAEIERRYPSIHDEDKIKTIIASNYSLMLELGE